MTKTQTPMVVGLTTQIEIRLKPQTGSCPAFKITLVGEALNWLN
jgi:hypothetical protein